MKFREKGERYRPIVDVIKAKQNGIPSRISINGFHYVLDIQATGPDRYDELRKKVRGKRA